MILQDHIHDNDNNYDNGMIMVLLMVFWCNVIQAVAQFVPSCLWRFVNLCGLLRIYFGIVKSLSDNDMSSLDDVDQLARVGHP